MKRLQLCLIYAGLLLSAGCYPVDVRWSPDSDGFVFVNEKNELVYYNLDAQSERVIAENVGHPCNMRPAFTPDGQSVAFASFRLDQEKECGELLVRTMPLEPGGDTSPSSVELTWPLEKMPEGQNRLAPYLIDFSKDGRYLLVSVDNVGPAICDLESEKLTPLADIELYMDVAMISGGVSCVTPDGEHFLGKKKGDEPLLELPVLIDWEGNVHDFTLDEETEAFKDALEAEVARIEALPEDQRQQAAEKSPFAYMLKGTDVSYCVWDNEGVLRKAFPGGKNVVLDTRRKTATIEDGGLVAELHALAEERQMLVQPIDEDGEILVLLPLNLAPTPDDTERTPQATVLLDRRTNAETPLLEETTEDVVCIIAPDRSKFILVETVDHGEGGDSQEIHVYDVQGKKLAWMPHFTDK